MPGKKAGITIIILVVLAGTVIFLNSWKKPLVNGSRLTINSRGHHLEGILTRSIPFQFLLKDKGVSVGTFSGDAFVTALPFDTAEQLRARYGDFFRCNEPGALQAVHSMQTMILVADGEITRRGLAEAVALVRRSRIPVVSFMGSRIQVSRQTYLGMEVNDGTGIPIYFVSNFRIIKPGYLK